MKDDDSVVVALATSLSGRSSPVGVAQRSAIETAVERLNGAGGAAGRLLELRVLDDGCSADGAQRAVREAIALRAAVIIGHPCAAAAEVAAHAYQAAGILFIAAGSRHPRLTEKRAGPLVFRSSGRDDRQGHDAAERLAVLAGQGGDVALVQDRTAMARAIVSGAAARLASLGHSRVTTLGIVAGEANYPEAVGILSTGRPAAILFAGFPAEAAILLRQIRAAGFGAPVLLSASNATVELLAHASEILDERVEVLRPVASAVSGSESGRVAASSAEIAVADAVTALEVWVAAASSAASVEANVVAPRLVSPVDAPAAQFDDSGDIRAPSFHAFVWRSGVWIATELSAAQ